jgi:hypothetical protein
MPAGPVFEHKARPGKVRDGVDLFGPENADLDLDRLLARKKGAH